jgi:predicted TIM-barrel fold metal-dependent hydrolase
MERIDAELDQPGGVTRRSLMAGAAAGAAGASLVGALAGTEATAQAATSTVTPPYTLPSGNYRIDLHSHFLPPEYVSAVQPFHLSLAPWTEAAHVAFMDTWGIDASVVALGAPTFFGDQTFTTNLARTVNQVGQGLLESNGSRFGVLATLPLPDVNAALNELSYALDTLGLDNGVVLAPQVAGVYLGDPSLAPLYEELNRRGCVVWVHPGFPPASEPPFPGTQQVILEFPFETTRAAANMIFQDVIPNYPNIRWQLSHVGGTLPFLLYRLGSLYGIPVADLQPAPQAAQNGPFVYAAKFYYDTAATGSIGQFQQTQEYVKNSQFVFGTDFPWTADLFAPNAPQEWPWFVNYLPSGSDPNPVLSQAFSRPNRLNLERANALALYPSVAARL